MQTLDFDMDWVDAAGIHGPELAATWASLRIRVGDSTVTRVLDERARTVRDFLYVPVYPLAEWLATNWWFLTRELENPAKRGSPDFQRRHSLGASREGYAFPDLEVVSTGERTRLAWKSGLSPWTGIEFLHHGEAWVDSAGFRESCAGLMDRVIRRLESFQIDGTLLQEEWTAIQAADEEEAEFCAATAGLGWDPYAMDDGKRDRVLLLAGKLGEVLAEAVPSLDTEGFLREDWLSIPRAIAEAKVNGLLLERLQSFQDEVRQGRQKAGLDPWAEGYDLARRLRRDLDLDGEPLPTMEAIAEVLGEAPESLDQVTRPVDSVHQVALVDGVITRDDDENPAFAFRRFGDAGRRFHFCRALAEVLTSPASDLLLTKAQSERQQRNRAFAAEFLAPSSGLRERVTRPRVDEDDMDELAAEFGVSSRVIEHQIPNHRIARVWRNA